MSGSFIRRAMVGAALWLPLIPAAQAGDELDKKLFLLNRALKNMDCDQAEEISGKLVAEFGNDPGAHLGRAKSLMCSGRYLEAWESMESYGELRGDARLAAAVNAELMDNVGVVELRIRPKNEAPGGGAIPPAYFEGVQVVVEGDNITRMRSEDVYKIAVLPGSHRVTVSDSSIPSASWSETVTFEAKAGSNPSVVVAPVFRGFDARVQAGALAPAFRYVLRAPDGKEHVIAAGTTVVVEPGGAAVQAEWQGLTRSGALQLVPGNQPLPLPRAVEVVGGPWTTPQRWMFDPTLSPASEQVTARVPGTEIDLSFLAPALAPGELRRADLTGVAFPALDAVLAVQPAQAAWSKARRNARLAGAGSAVLAGVTLWTRSQALEAAAGARGLGAGDTEAEYADLADTAKRQARLANVEMGATVLGVGFTGELVHRSLKKRKDYRALASQVTSSARDPLVLKSDLETTEN